jgi:hypothetical protein
MLDGLSTRWQPFTTKDTKSTKEHRSAGFLALKSDLLGVSLRALCDLRGKSLEQGRHRHTSRNMKPRSYSFTNPKLALSITSGKVGLQTTQIYFTGTA